MVEQVRELKHSLAPDVTRALRDAFGDAPIEEISVLGGGASGALLLSLTVAGAGYVLKRPDPERLAHESRIGRELACMKIASERGVAPELRYAHAATGISIMERIDGGQLGRGATGGSRRIERVARAVRRLHEGPPFPKGPSTAGVVRLFNETLRARGMEGLPALIVSTLEETERVMQRFAATAPCHNDLNPANMLQTEEAIYLVDWETATQGDPFFDLGELGVFAFPTASQRGELLEAYLGRSPSEEERARATLARGMALGFYAAAFVCASTMRGGTAQVADEGTAMPGPELLRDLAEGRVGPEVVAASLMGEMRREMERPEWVEAKRALDAS